MKKNNLYIILSLILLSFSACLDEDPKYTLNGTTVYESEETVEQALLGCYGYMTISNGYGQMWQEIPVAASGLTWTGHGGSDNDRMVLLDMSATNGMVTYPWNGMYKVISEVNAFLGGIEGSSLRDEFKQQKIGEAKCLRALAYYNLITLFGDVPLKKIASSSDGISSSRVPKEEVFNFLLQDLEDALTISQTSSVGRFNSWAVKALQGKIYYKMATLDINKTENLNKAKAKFDEVYNAHVYQLEPNFSTLFGSFVNKSKESIIQFNFTTTSTISYNRGSNRFAPPTSTTGISWGTYSPLKAAYDLHYGTYPNDPRINVNFLTRYRARTGNSQPNPEVQARDFASPNDSIYTYPYLTYTANIKTATAADSVFKNGVKGKELIKYVAVLPYDKFPNKMNPSVNVIDNYRATSDTLYNYAVRNSVKDVFAKSGSQTLRPWYGKLYDQNQIGTYSSKNLMVYRYSEMLLLMADVYNELGYTSQAVGFVNEVLDRARTSDNSKGVEPKAWSASLSQSQVKEKLYFEKIIELMGEPSMFDVTRQGGIEMLRKLLTLNNSHEITAASVTEFYITRNNWLDNFFNTDATTGVTTLTDDYLKRNLLLPIPSSEIASNPGIDYSQNNYGY